LIVAQPGKHQDSSYLIRLMAQEKVTVLHAVPSLLRVLVEEKEIERCTCLNYVFSGGEVLSAELQERFFDRLTVNLCNLCGPTETCVESTFWTCRRDPDQRTVPIGRPIANTQIYLLDRHKQPVPVGVTGELYIGGAGLARGYLNRPEMTAEKFLPDPFTTEPGARLYRTGDLGRYLPNGNIEFLGRIDHQVKIRGFRIELGEIEAVLAQHPTVRESVVIAREDRAGDKRIVAYFIPHEGAPAIIELRGYLKRSLPEYMVPSAWVILESFPLTPNGKVDRKALPNPDFSRTTLEQGYVAPQDSVEGIIAMVWSEVLRRGPIGRHDNFFDLGGHSLKATQVVSRLRKVFRSEISLRHLFEFPTISALAAAIDSNAMEKLNNEQLDRLLIEHEAMLEEEAERLLADHGIANRQT
jgi:non-ribosomal peptide synthetase component E (peptide arylation enzyme)/acyl carrier protein